MVQARDEHVGGAAAGTDLRRREPVVVVGERRVRLAHDVDVARGVDRDLARAIRTEAVVVVDDVGAEPPRAGRVQLEYERAELAHRRRLERGRARRQVGRVRFARDVGIAVGVDRNVPDIGRRGADRGAAAEVGRVDEAVARGVEHRDEARRFGAGRRLVRLQRIEYGIVGGR
ncbi:MAG TPA: hypothetical protein VND91_01925, partial [Candidatus Saccharimonadia bacterium]|nr:hypothetical protein [Candidatus Saccharimonadia bacterium]